MSTTRFLAEYLSVEEKTGGGLVGGDYRKLILATADVGSFWRFGEPSGSAVADETGASGLSLTNATLGATGAVAGDTAADFNGTNARADLNEDLYDFGGTSPFTLEVWAEPDTLPTTATIIGKWFAFGSDGWYWQLLSTGRMLFARDTATFQSSPVLVAGAYQLLAVTYDGATLRFVQNGVDVGNFATTAAVTDHGAAPARIGELAGSARFDGRLDEMAVYTRALTLAELREHYIAGKRGATGLGVVGGGVKSILVSKVGGAGSAASAGSSDSDVLVTVDGGATTGASAGSEDSDVGVVRVGGAVASGVGGGEGFSLVEKEGGATAAASGGGADVEQVSKEGGAALGASGSATNAIQTDKAGGAVATGAAGGGDLVQASKQGGAVAGAAGGGADLVQTDKAGGGVSGAVGGGADDAQTVFNKVGGAIAGLAGGAVRVVQADRAAGATSGLTGGDLSSLLVSKVGGATSTSSASGSKVVLTTRIGGAAAAGTGGGGRVVDARRTGGAAAAAVGGGSDVAGAIFDRVGGGSAGTVGGGGKAPVVVKIGGARSGTPFHDALSLLSGLQSHWRANEGSGSVLDAIGSVHGTVNGTVARQQPGLLASDPDTGLIIGTPPSDTGYVDFGDAYDFAGTAAFTFGILVKPSLVDATQRRIFAKRVTDGGGIQGYELRQSSGGVFFTRWRDGAGDQVASAGALGTSAATFLIVTYDGATLRMYRQGALEDAQLSGVSLLNTSAALNLGRLPDGTAHFFGAADEFFVFNRALTASEVLALFTNATRSGAVVGGGVKAVEVGKAGGATTEARGGAGREVLLPVKAGGAGSVAGGGAGRTVVTQRLGGAVVGSHGGGTDVGRVDRTGGARVGSTGGAARTVEVPKTGGAASKGTGGAFNIRLYEKVGGAASGTTGGGDGELAVFRVGGARTSTTGGGAGTYIWLQPLVMPLLAEVTLGSVAELEDATTVAEVVTLPSEAEV